LSIDSWHVNLFQYPNLKKVIIIYKKQVIPLKMILPIDFLLNVSAQVEVGDQEWLVHCQINKNQQVLIPHAKLKPKFALFFLKQIHAKP
jgi:hypothetical protein